MKTNVFLWAIIAIVLTFSACNKEDTFSMQQEDLLPEVEQTGTDLDAYAHLEESVQAIIRSLDLSMKGLPANVSEITLSPTGAINPNGEARLAIATGTFTSAILVKAQDLASGQDLAAGTITGTGMMGFTTLAIPAYNAASGATNRVVGFFYWGTTNQWELFHFETQAPTGGIIEPPVEEDNFQIPGTNVILAKQDARSEGNTGSLTMPYSTANGIGAQYNDPNLVWTAGTNIIYSTGCNAYYEKSDASDKGKWRVPADPESRALMHHYMSTNETHGMDFFTNFYWTTYEYPGMGALTMYYQSPEFYLHFKRKTDYCRVRCVRVK